MNVIAVDVGTVSVRLAIIAFQGDRYQEANILASHKKNIKHYQDGCKFEQSSREVWNAICECSRECIKSSKVPVDSIRGIAFSATCSLVIDEGRDKSKPSSDNDIIMWMDHRAIKEAQKITSGCSDVLKQFGGVCSPEFSLAKLVWLKEHDPARFNSASGFFELPDWLVYRCIGEKYPPHLSSRSLCCVTCKWGYDVENKCHCDILTSLSKDIQRKIGLDFSVSGPGEVAGYLDFNAASELGLIESDSKVRDKENRNLLKVAVGTSLIDAHSGMLAMLSVPLKNFNIESEIESTFCSLVGTSSCHMLLSKNRNFTQGIWGPYKDVIVQGYYLLEAGQSMTGKLIEMSIESHEEGKFRLKNGENMHEIISSLNSMVEKDSNLLTVNDLHILPTFHGNRSPLANPRLRGGIYGLSSEGPKSLIEHYVATVESLAYETKLIVEALGTKLNTVLVSGGLMKNTLYMRTLSDVLNCEVIKMTLENIDFMVMGSGLVARHAALNSSTIGKTGPLTRESIESIQYKQLGIENFKPNSGQFGYHEKKYKCYKEFVEFSKRVDKIMHVDQID